MKIKSVNSINPSQSVIQTTNDIVKAHGGTLHIYSIPSEKSVFKISFDKTGYQ